MDCAIPPLVMIYLAILQKAIEKLLINEGKEEIYESRESAHVGVDIQWREYTEL